MNTLLILKEGKMLTPKEIAESEFQLSEDSDFLLFSSYRLEMDCMDVIRSFSDKVAYLMAAGAYIQVGKEYDEIVAIIKQNFPWIKKIELDLDLVQLNSNNVPDLLKDEDRSKLLTIQGKSFINEIYTHASSEIFKVFDIAKISISDFLFSTKYVILVNDHDIDKGILTQLNSTCLFNHRNVENTYFI